MLFVGHVLTSFSVVWLGGSATPAGQLPERGCVLTKEFGCLRRDISESHWLGGASRQLSEQGCPRDFIETTPQVDTDAQEHLYMAKDSEHVLNFCHKKCSPERFTPAMLA